MKPPAIPVAGAPRQASVLRLGALGLMLALAGCATGPNAAPSDPLEPFNRGVYRFNEGLDQAVLKPVAQGYVAVVPALARQGVTNFFANIGDLLSSANSLLQLKPGNAAENLLRFEINTLFGFAGLLDIATELGIERHKEDFGQTLAYWGVPAGPYLVLPVLGSSTLRDVAGIKVDSLVDPRSNVDPIETRNAGYALRGIDTRANLLRAGNVLEEAALDKYSFVRDAYLRKRENDVHDGNPPRGAEDRSHLPDPPAVAVLGIPAELLDPPPVAAVPAVVAAGPVQSHAIATPVAQPSALTSLAGE